MDKLSVSALPSTGTHAVVHPTVRTRVRLPAQPGLVPGSGVTLALACAGAVLLLARLLA